jgi:hypothetical protein
LQDPAKFTQIGIFLFEKKHLATLQYILGRQVLPVSFDEI